MSEEWRVAPIDGYEVSDMGNVRNSRTGRMLKPWFHKSGHAYVNLGGSFRGQVHQLVLIAFGFERPEGAECRHLNGDPRDNRVGNLQWGTRAENIADLKTTSGRFARALFTDEVAAEIRAQFTGKHGEQARLARKYNVSISTIHHLVHRRTY